MNRQSKQEEATSPKLSSSQHKNANGSSSGGVSLLMLIAVIAGVLFMGYWSVYSQPDYSNNAYSSFEKRLEEDRKSKKAHKFAKNKSTRSTPSDKSSPTLGFEKASGGAAGGGGGNTNNKKRGGGQKRTLNPTTIVADDHQKEEDARIGHAGLPRLVDIFDHSKQKKELHHHQIQQQQQHGVDGDQDYILYDKTAHSESGDERQLASQTQAAEKEVRRIRQELKKQDKLFEESEVGQKAAIELQKLNYALLLARFGGDGDVSAYVGNGSWGSVWDSKGGHRPLPKPYRVRLHLKFQPSIPDFHEKGDKGEILIEVVSHQHLPHNVYTFLEICRGWKTGAFHRNVANFLVQAMNQNRQAAGLAFQEFDDKHYRHNETAVGYAGRPSSPHFYISLMDSTRTMGRGSQQKRNSYEADGIIGRVIEGYYDVVKARLTKMPGKGFIDDKSAHVLIEKIDILVPVVNKK